MSTMEIFKAVKYYEGLYDISTHGRIRSRERIVRSGSNGKRVIPERIRKVQPNKEGYLQCTLSKNCETKSHLVHHLVWQAFGDRAPNYPAEHIDHIDNDKRNNAISNLQILSARDNVAKMWNMYPRTSKHTGVSFDKKYKKWYAYIRVDGKKQHLGIFATEEEAAQAYINAKLTIVLLAA